MLIAYQPTTKIQKPFARNVADYLTKITGAVNNNHNHNDNNKLWRAVDDQFINDLKAAQNNLWFLSTQTKKV